MPTTSYGVKPATTTPTPVDGWYWFDTEEEARLFFDLPLELLDALR
jgi:hypothetical protein